MNSKSESRGFMNKVMDLTVKMAGPLAKFADKPSISSIQNGLINVMPLIIIGSVFLVLYVLGSPSVGSSGKALLPFLAPLGSKFIWLNTITMSFMSLYASMTIAQNYGERLGLEVKSSGIIGLTTFLAFVLSGADKNGGIPTTAFSATGLFVAIVTSLVSVRIYHFCIRKKITIKMPSSVPPSIGNAFTALIPYAVSLTLAWIIRSVLDFDMVTWLTKVLSPIVSGADNVVTFTVKTFITNILWSVGLHGDNMFGTLFTPFVTIWLDENAKALQAGLPLPHVWTLNGLERLQNWPTTVWPLIFLMIRSKVKYLRALGCASLPAGIFTIIEPVIFGLPLALNPFLIIPFLLSGTITAIVGYLAMAFGIVGKYFASLPWATPPFITGPLGTGDWKTIPLLILFFLIGLVIYYPFWKQFEKVCLQKEKEKEEKDLKTSKSVQSRELEEEEII